MRLGELLIESVSDGTSLLPADFFGQTEGAVHQSLRSPDGRLELPIGCFVVRTGEMNVVIDAGLGPRTIEFQPPGGPLRLEGGGLPQALAATGLTPADVDLVLLSHLHADHSGWVWHEERPFFPNALVRFGRAEWQTFVEDGFPGTDAEAFRALAALDRIDLVDGDAVLAPGLSCLHTPGHTPGHLTFVVSDGTRRALILGDALSCPLQVEQPELEAMADMDRALGIRTRDRILQEIEGSDLVSGPHFPEVRFGRVVLGQGRRLWS